MSTRQKTSHPLKPTPDQWRFFRQWLKNPLAVAAISPSSQQLAKQMIAELPAGAKRVIELGGGTGVFTHALINHGIAPSDMLVLELNEDLHHHLQQRFSEVHVVCGDAMELPSIAERCGFAADGPADAVLSGLGLLSMSRATQRSIVEAAFAVLAPEGRLVQFTYGPTCPINKDVLAALSLQARRASLTLWNMPPATIYVITRLRSTAITPTSMR